MDFSCLCTHPLAHTHFALGGPFAFLPWYQAVYGAVLLPLFTFIVGIIIPNAASTT